MDRSLELTIEDEVSDVRMGRPHVVILGAGASRAVCPSGDKNGRALPLMADFAACTGLTSLLKGWGVDPLENFEDTYSTLHDAGEVDKLAALNAAVETYFGGLELPDHPTLYDHLVMSLRGNDIIATFNWDPLLLQAYRRCSGHVKLPRLAFLHGNLGAGYCERDLTLGFVGALCSRCGEPFARTPLLYPVRSKEYAKDVAISSQWEFLQHGLEHAFMITVFGYSGPKTDKEAIDLMRGAWGSPVRRSMEQTEFVTRQSENEVSEAWTDFIHSHHYEVHDDFYNSWIAKHPRRTGEAYLSQYLDAKFIADNPIPRDLDFPDLFAWFRKFRPAEDASI